MTQTERLADPYYKHFDVPIEDQIVRRDGGIAKQADSLPTRALNKRVWYHGTGSDIKGAFKPSNRGAIFLTDDPKMAESFATRATASSDNAGPNIMPVMFNGEIFDFSNKTHIARATKAMKKYLNDESLAEYVVKKGDTKYGIEGTDLEMAVRDAGFDGYKIPSEKGIAVFDPKNIRSVFDNE